MRNTANVYERRMLTVPNVSKGQTMNVLYLLVIQKKNSGPLIACIIAWALQTYNSLIITI